MKNAFINPKLLPLYSAKKYTYIHFATFNKGIINKCYKSLQSDDELAKSLIDMSIIDNNKCNQSNLNECPDDHIKSASNSDFGGTAINDLWSDYESFKKKPIYQDLTHQEYTQLSEIRDKQRYKEFKRTYNLQNLATNPIYQGKIILRELKKSTNNSNVIVDENNQDDVLNQKNNEKTSLYEIVSRIRSKIRSEKLANTKIAKATIPSVDGQLLDPIKAHVEMRRTRISSMLGTHIEHIITNSSPTIVKEILNGASISIHHVKMTSSKSTCKVYYTILSKHDSSEIQQSLDNNAWKIRFYIAKKLQLGYTPPIKFIHQSPSLMKNIPNLYRRIVPPFVSSIEKPLHLQKLLQPTPAYTTNDHKDRLNSDVASVKIDKNDVLDNNKGIEFQIKAWKRVISGFG